MQHRRLPLSAPRPMFSVLGHEPGDPPIRPCADALRHYLAPEARQPSEGLLPPLPGGLGQDGVAMRAAPSVGAQNTPWQQHGPRHAELAPGAPCSLGGARREATVVLYLALGKAARASLSVLDDREPSVISLGEDQTHLVQTAEVRRGSVSPGEPARGAAKSAIRAGSGAGSRPTTLHFSRSRLSGPGLFRGGQGCLPGDLLH